MFSFGTDPLILFLDSIYYAQSGCDPDNRKDIPEKDRDFFNDRFFDVGVNVVLARKDPRRR